ncbi:MAG TPA: TfuA-like protein [Polyangiaceae bacterium]|nr:TfuA-like protein [Polyangiaceae bacterium]
MKICIFLGPSLAIEEARRLLPEATFLPPAKMGDICTLASSHDPPDVIGVIDGVFEQVPSVWHKEILFAISRGIQVYGASSMGALRAAELHPFGMRGVGRVFEAYACGEYEDDDEVAVVHAAASAGHKPLSEAMVNIREGLRLARQDGLIDDPTHQSLIDMAKGQFYPERSWRGLFRLVSQSGIAKERLTRLAEFIAERDPNIKRADAMALLERVRADVATAAPPYEPDYQFSSTVFWKKLQQSASSHGPSIGALGQVANGAAAQNAVLIHAKVAEPRWREVQRDGLLRVLIQDETRRRGLEADEQRISAAAQSFRRERGLVSGEATRAWLTENELSREEFSSLMEIEALYELVLEQERARVDQIAISELKRAGRLGELRREVNVKISHLAQLGIDGPNVEDTGNSPTELLKWYETQFGALQCPLSEHALRIGFASSADFLRAVAELYLAERQAMRTAAAE